MNLRRGWQKKRMCEMTINSVLEEVLKEDVIETPSKDKTITLHEENQMEVKVVALYAAVTAIRTGECSHSSALGDGPWRKMCDYLLIVKSDCGIHVVFVELKKTLTPDKKKVASEQLRRSLPLLDYLLSVCKIEGSNIEETQPITKYVIIAERLRRFDKESVKNSRNKMTVTEHYKGIDIAMFGTKRLTLTLDELINLK